MDRLKWFWFGIRRWLLIKLAGRYSVVINARVVGYVSNVNPDWSVTSNSSFVDPSWQETACRAMGILPSNYAAKVDRLYEQMLRENDGDHG